MDTVLIFAGGDSPLDNLVGELPDADLIIAADSGYDVAVSAGFPVDVLVGDMDSIATEVIPGHAIVERHSPDKDSTDLELALEKVISERPGRIVVVGGAGGRFDHELATAGLLCSERWRSVEEIDWSVGQIMQQVPGDSVISKKILAMLGFEHELAPEAVDSFTLTVHDVVIFEDVFTSLEVSRLDGLLRSFDLF